MEGGKWIRKNNVKREVRQRKAGDPLSRNFRGKRFGAQKGKGGTSKRGKFDGKERKKG